MAEAVQEALQHCLVLMNRQGQRDGQGKLYLLIATLFSTVPYSSSFCTCFPDSHVMILHSLLHEPWKCMLHKELEAPGKDMDNLVAICNFSALSARSSTIVLR